MASQTGHLHFLGIGGHTMGGLAVAAKALGYKVTGTDEMAYDARALSQADIQWWKQADPRHLDGVTELIISGGSAPDNPEIVAARDRQIPIKSFAEFFGNLTKSAKSIVVSGTHGKTTTTSLVAWVLEVAGKKPDYLLGIKPHNFDSSVRLAGSSVVVCEGDEYRASQLDNRSKFAFYHPDVLVITSVELDHPDFFQNLTEVKEHFAKLVERLPESGRLYYHELPDSILSQAGAGHQVLQYGQGDAGWHTSADIGYTPQGLTFALYREDRRYGELQVPLYGHHNVLNATVAAGVALDEGVPWTTVKQAFRTFRGAARRFERVSAPGQDIIVLDDYAHHPTEVAATIAAAKRHSGRRVVAILQPHTFSRVELLYKEFGKAIRKADIGLVAEIEGAREKHRAHQVSGEDVAKAAGPSVRYIGTRDALVQAVVEEAQPGDTVLCMTVGGYQKLARELARRLQNPGQSKPVRS